VVKTSSVITPQVVVEWASWDAHRASRVEGSPATPSEVLRTMTRVGGPNYLGGSTIAVMVALSLACHSEGVGPAGVRSCFQLRKHGVHICGNQWMCGYLSGRGVGGRVVTALSSFAFLHDQVFR